MTSISITLQKFLQKSVKDNRREIRQNIIDGFVKMNHRILTNPQELIHPQKDIIHYRNKTVKLNHSYHYFLLNKPKNVITTLSDPEGRKTIFDLIRPIKERIYPVGRLDYKSEGLIFLTNDGDLTNFIISPKNKIPKTYIVKLSGNITEQKLVMLEKKGIFIENQKIFPLKVRKLNNSKKPRVLIQIFEGKKHIVRKIFKFCGFPVLELKRYTIGTLKLGKLPSGQYRKITLKEVETFKKEYDFPQQLP